MSNEKNSQTILKQDVSPPKPEADIKQALLIKRESLSQLLKELGSNISKFQEQYSTKLEELQARKRPLEDALQHIEALLRFEGYYADNSQPDSYGENTREASGKESVTDATYELLTEVHKPLHYRDITLRLQEKNIFIPGKEPAATLLSRINRDSRFKRAAKRGMYALSIWRIRSAKPKRTHKAKRAK